MKGVLHMKKGIIERRIKIALLGVISCLSIGFPVCAKEDPQNTEGIEISSENFPDELLREYVEAFDTVQDGFLSTEEIAEVKTMQLYNGFTDITGIKYFTALEELRLSGDRIKSLDLSGCTSLKKMVFYGDPYFEVDSLNLEGCTSLIELNCTSNNLSELNLKGCTSLTQLNCSGSNLSELDLKDCTSLKRLECNRNNLSSLDVSKCVLLERLWCDQNNLKKLDVSANTALVQIYCADNEIESLDVSSNTALTTLLCDRNDLSTLDVSANAALTSLHCACNRLSRLDLRSNKKMRALDASGNGTLCLLVGKNSKLARIFKEGKRYESSTFNPKGEGNYIYTIIYKLDNENILYLGRDVIIGGEEPFVGWKQDSGLRWRYFNKNGTLAIGWTKIKNKWYYFDRSGIMKTGWKKYGGKWYYLSPDYGYMITGWKKFSYNWYYFKTDGSMAEKEYCRGYWLESNGVCTREIKASWHKTSKGWWYGDASGWYAKDQKLKIDGIICTFDKEGYLVE